MYPEKWRQVFIHLSLERKFGRLEAERINWFTALLHWYIIIIVIIICVTLLEIENRWSFSNNLNYKWILFLHVNIIWDCLLSRGMFD